jgi:SAM-dependent methyltransferase
MADVKTHFNLAPADYDAMRGGHFAERHKRLIRPHLDARAGRPCSVVELGCGSGKFLADLAAEYPAFDFLGLDIDAKLAAYARETYTRPNLRFEERDIVRDGPPGECDLLICIDVLHHVHDPAAFFPAARRLLRPEGGWFISEPNVYHPYIYWSIERMKKAGYDEDQYRPWVAEPHMRRAGFAVNSRRYALFFPGWSRELSPGLRRVEGLLEGWRFLGGKVVYYLTVTASEP